MYNTGIEVFLNLKKVNIREGVKAFIKHKGVKTNPYDNYEASAYIQSNWEAFASFIDKSIKDGTLKGTAVKLNSYYQEQRQRNEMIRAQTKELNITKEEQRIFNRIKKEGPGFLYSFLMSNGVQPCKKDLTIISKTQQYLPLVRLALENNYNI